MSNDRLCCCHNIIQVNWAILEKKKFRITETNPTTCIMKAWCSTLKKPRQTGPCPTLGTDDVHPYLALIYPGCYIRGASFIIQKTWRYLFFPSNTVPMLCYKFLSILFCHQICDPFGSGDRWHHRLQWQLPRHLEWEAWMETYHWDKVGPITAKIDFLWFRLQDPCRPERNKK